VINYLDDALIFSKTFEEHLEHLAKTFERIRLAGLCLNPKKGHFGYDEIPLLGHIITAQGNTIPEDQVSAIHHLPRPKSVEDIRSAFGLAEYYQQYVKNFLIIAAPLNRLRRKNTPFKWTED